MWKILLLDKNSQQISSALFKPSQALQTFNTLSLLQATINNDAPSYELTLHLICDNDLLIRSTTIRFNQELIGFCRIIVNTKKF